MSNTGFSLYTVYIFRGRFLALEKNVETLLNPLFLQGLEQHPFQGSEPTEIYFRSAHSTIRTPQNICDFLNT